MPENLFNLLKASTTSPKTNRWVHLCKHVRSGGKVSDSYLASKS